MAYKFTTAQKDALFAMSCQDSLLLAYDPGMGKTAVALEWLILRFREHRIEDALVLCPASLVPNWQAAIDKMAMFEGVGPADIRELKERVTIRSFQRTYRVDRRKVAHRDGRVTTSRSLSLRDDVDKRWGALIIDESHCIGAHDSLQTKSAIALGRLSRYRYLLTGTPVSGGGGAEDFSKLYGQLMVLQPGIFTNWTAFCREYVTGYNRWFKPTGYDVPKCRRLLEDHAIVARLEDCYDMPGSTETDMPCILAAEAKRVYKDMQKGETSAYGVTIKAAGGQYPKMLQTCSGSLKRDDGSVMKFKCSKDDVLAALLNGTDDPVVVFCNYRASIDRAADVCRRVGRRVLTFDGRTPKKGTPPWKDFQDGKADAIVCQYQSGGVGVDLYRSHSMILFDPCYSALLLKQSLARIYRKGQETHCLYYYLVTSGTVEERAWRTVRSGKDITDAMMRDWAIGGLDL